MSQNEEQIDNIESLPSSQVRLALEREFGAHHFRTTESLGKFLRAIRRGQIGSRESASPCLTCLHDLEGIRCRFIRECLAPGTHWDPRPENLGPFPEQTEIRRATEGGKKG